MKKRTVATFITVGTIVSLAVAGQVYNSSASEKKALNKIETVEKSFTKSDKHLEELISTEMIRKNNKVSTGDIITAIERLEFHVNESKDLSSDLNSKSETVKTQLDDYQNEIDNTKEKIANVTEMLKWEKELTENLGKEIKFTQGLVKGNDLVSVSKLEKDKLVALKDRVQKEVKNADVKSHSSVILDKAIDNTDKRNKVNTLTKEIKDLSKEGVDFSDKEKELNELTKTLQDNELSNKVSKDLEDSKNSLNSVIEAKKEEEAQAQAQQVQAQAQETPKEETSNSNSSQGQVASRQRESAPKPVTTDGFNFNGYSFPIGSWSGAGGELVPADGFIYSWTEMANHYLIERMGAAGGPILSVQVGTQIIINGQSYTVTDMAYASNNDSSGYDWVANRKGSGITFQTCADATGNTLILWHAV